LAESPLIYIFLHHNADPDALCSGEAIKELILNFREDCEISMFVDSLNVSSKRIASSLGMQINNSIPEKQPNLIITVDTANYSQLNIFEDYVKQSEVTKIVIDHHEISELVNEANLIIHNTKLGSTCLIVSKLYQELGIVPSPRVSTILICGHIYDSRRFIHGTSAEVFHLIANLIEFGGNYDEANQYLQNDMTLGERIARIKASRRINYRLQDDLIIATSKVSAFEASAARSLIGMGCDVVLVFAKKNDEIRGSARTTAQNLHMGEVLSQLVSEHETEWSNADVDFAFSSGGHKNAAGLNIKPPIDS
jgi:nanoRNase/pAp phosphatase (c-di-AMP/oligoRNAs hydrolase)